MEALLALLALAAVVFFALDGLNVRSARFEPRGFGLACATLVALWPAIHALTN
ncbi:hypothetical protein [Dactylosporangium salmoneum]|uniref:Uncharacterized protein n=1 Tax=Dactylosporangium salmoneum TaxID=53361 RepID=A0ABP5T7C1_9ACTN